MWFGIADHTRTLTRTVVNGGLSFVAGGPARALSSVHGVVRLHAAARRPPHQGNVV